ncbi:Nephrocystin-3 [Trichoplax sp. H2]|nr:Nephrocystin-3 [Trichoplax sp. H2]|eukprot:RDD43187.1 Nephrocystin-3 [Trichoplax sp. H2]
MATDQYFGSVSCHHLQSLFEKGRKEMLAYNFEKALSCYSQIIDKIGLMDDISANIDGLQCDIYIDICYIYTEQYELIKAKELVEKSYQLANKLQDEVRIARCLYRRAEIKILQGDLDGAMEDSQKSLEIKLKSGIHNLHIANGYEQVGRIYDEGGKCNEARSMHYESLKIRMSVFGRDHFDIAKSDNHIRELDRNQNKLDETLSVKSLKIKLSLLSRNHSKISHSSNNSREAHTNQCIHDKVPSVPNSPLETHSPVLGHNHPHAAELYNNLGTVYYNQGKYDKAFTMYDKSLRILLSVVGPYHPHIADSYSNLAIVYGNQSEYEKALCMHGMSLNIRSTIHGHNHPDVATSYSHMGDVYDSQGKYDEALSMYDKSLQIRLSILDDNHPSVVLTKHNITNTFQRKQSMLTGKPVKNPQQTVQQSNSNSSTKSSGNNDFSQALKGKIYYNAYIRALNQGRCYNNLIRGMFTGPRFVGKSSIMEVFTGIQQVLIKNQAPTQILQKSNKVIEIKTYRIRDMTICHPTDIFNEKVMAVIWELVELAKDYHEDISGQMNRQTTAVNVSTKDRNKCPIAKLSRNMTEFTPPRITITQSKFHSHQVQAIFQHYFKSMQNVDNYIHHDNQYVKVWDFGGHAFYQVTHYPFMSPNSIYFLVFNITQGINDKVMTRSGKSLNITYLQSMQEWLTSIIAGHSSHDKIPVKFDNQCEEYSLPIIILIASHGDCIPNENEKIDRFKKFGNELISSMPSYKSNIYSSGIIFNCDPEDNSPSTMEERKRCCLQLHSVMKQFVQSVPFMKNPIPIRWYIMATILHKSVSYHVDQGNNQANNEVRTSAINEIMSDEINNIMTIQQVTLLSKKYGLYESDEELIKMLMYLHDLGEVIFCDKVGDGGVIVTDVDWLLRIFRVIIQLHDYPFGSLDKQDEYEKVRKTGRISTNYIDYVLEEFKLDDDTKRNIIDLMESYDIVCGIRDGQNKVLCEYFVPYLLQPDAKPFDLSQYHLSDWLYIGFELEDIPYVTDGIYYCLLSSCLKEWNNTKVEIYYQCAKYYLKEDHHYIIIKKEESYIGLQYCYQKLEQDQADKLLEQKIKESIRNKCPQDIIKNKLSSIVHERMPKFKNALCYYYVRCKCNRLTRTINKCSLQDVQMINCEHCNTLFPSQFDSDWMIYDDGLMITQKPRKQQKLHSNSNGQAQKPRKRQKLHSDSNGQAQKPRKRQKLHSDSNGQADITRYFFTIAEFIGTDWTRLAARLDSQIDISPIKRQNSEVFDQTIAFLQIWRRQHKNATTKELLDAFQDLRRKDIISKIENMQGST